MKSIADVQERHVGRRQQTDLSAARKPKVTPSHWGEAAINYATAVLAKLPETGTSQYNELLVEARTAVRQLPESYDTETVEVAAAALSQLSQVPGLSHTSGLSEASHKLLSALHGTLLARR